MAPGDRVRIIDDPNMEPLVISEILPGDPPVTEEVAIFVEGGFWRTSRLVKVDEWPAMNRERGLLIDKAIARSITAVGQERLEELQALADQYIERVAPRPTEVLEMLEARIKEGR